MSFVFAPNRLAELRAAAGIPNAEALAEKAGIDPKVYAHIEAGEVLPTPEEFRRLSEALGGVDLGRTFAYALATHVGPMSRGSVLPTGKSDYGKVSAAEYFPQFFGGMSDAQRLLVSREEARWSEQFIAPAGPIDVFVQLACGMQRVPHLMLDTMAVLEKLGVRAAAGTGVQFCCGMEYQSRAYYDPKPSKGYEAADRVNRLAYERSAAYGAGEIVRWCTRCMLQFTQLQRRRTMAGESPPTPDPTWILDLVERRLAELGDRVPWQTAVPARVFVQGHAHYSPTHERARNTVERVLEMVPGVEVMGDVNAILPFALFDRDRDTPVREMPRNAQEAEQLRAELAEIVNAHGGDVISTQHQRYHQLWSTLSSDRLAVRHAISFVAEALGCAHPDRHQAAAKLGDPQKIVDQTRPLWSTWGLDAAGALEIAKASFNPNLRLDDQCGSGCGGADCGTDLIHIDVLSGSVQRG